MMEQGVYYFRASKLFQTQGWESTVHAEWSQNWYLEVNVSCKKLEDQLFQTDLRGCNSEKLHIPHAKMISKIGTALLISCEKNNNRSECFREVQMTLWFDIWW